jgi:hypothetical protein
LIRALNISTNSKALRRAVEAAGIDVGVWVMLREMLKLADVDLADQSGDVLIVLVARLGLGDADLTKPWGIDFDNGEPGDFAVEGVQARKSVRLIASRRSRA